MAEEKEIIGIPELPSKDEKSSELPLEAEQKAIEVQERVSAATIIEEQGEIGAGEINNETESKIEEQNEFSVYNNPGEYKIPDEDKEKLHVFIDNKLKGDFAKLPGLTKIFRAYVSGHPVATEADYRTETKSYSTKTGFVEVNGRKYFVVYNYPNSSRHRKGDTGCRKNMGEIALKATEENWREVFLKRSLIPAHASEDPRIVVLPFIPNVGMVDLLEKYNSNKFDDEYEFAHQYNTLNKRLELVRSVASAMRSLHKDNNTRGEIIPANVGITPDQKILFFDPETPYPSKTDLLEQKARDLKSWCISACGALNRMHKDLNFKEVIKSIFEAYEDNEVVQYLKENLCEKLSFKEPIKHPIAFPQMKARLTLNSRKQYNNIIKAMLDPEGEFDHTLSVSKLKKKLNKERQR